MLRGGGVPARGNTEAVPDQEQAEKAGLQDRDPAGIRPLERVGLAPAAHQSSNNGSGFWLEQSGALLFSFFLFFQFFFPIFFFVFVVLLQAELPPFEEDCASRCED